MSNYHVRRSGEDEYLEHAGGWKWSKPTKYLTKLNIGGKVRYIYTQAQLAAARGMSRVANATGYSARRGMNAAKSRYEVQNSKGGPGSRSRAARAKATAKAYERRYNRSLLGRLENAGKKARDMVGNASKAARQAGENFTGSIRKEAYKVPGAIKRARRVASKAIDTHITGASAKRAANAESNRWKTQNSKSGPGSRSRANRAKANAQAYEKKYRNSLAGRLDSLGDWANSQRKKAGKSINNAGKNIANRATEALTEANRLGRKAKRKVKGLTTPKKAPRKPAKEVKVRDYTKINRNNEKSAEQYQYFDKDAGWATNSRAAADRLGGHTSHNKRRARSMRKRGRNANRRITQ